jgi:hypothetical protein
MSEPIIDSWIGPLSAISDPLLYFWVGILLAILIVFSVRPFLRSRLARRAMQRLDSAAPALMADIEADMEQVHSQIAVATRRLEMSVEQMKAKTTTQLAEIGRSSEVIGRLKGELTERAAQLAALQGRERAVSGQLQATVAELAVKTSALADVDRMLGERKAELAKFLSEFDVHPTLAKAESRHLAEMERMRAEKALVEEQLRQSRDECLKLQYEIEMIGKQVETTWASERMANAVLRERINDVATEVVRVAVALEGLGLPVEALIAGRGATVQLDAEAAAPTGENGQNGQLPAIMDGSDDAKADLVHRVRALRKRSNQLTAPG